MEQALSGIETQMMWVDPQVMGAGWLWVEDLQLEDEAELIS